MSRKPIELRIPGDHVALEGLADALDKTVLAELRGRESALAANEVNFEPSWRGEAADAFVGCCLELKRDIASKVSDYVADVGEVIRAYAWRIRRGKDLFADYADRARQSGLIVQGDYILAPTLHDPNDPDAPCSVTDIDPRAVIGLGDPFALFDEITQKVGEWHGEDTVWIADYFGPLMQKADAASGLSKLLDHFEVTEFDLFNAGLEGSKHRVGERTVELQETFARYKDDFDRFTGARHAANYQMKRAELAITGDEFRSTVQRVEESLDAWRKAGTVLKAAGPAATVAEAATGVLEGRTFGETAAGIGGGAAGAALGVRIGARFGLPGILGGALFFGTGGNAIGQWGWELSGRPLDTHLPLGVREEIMSWLTKPGELETGQPRMG